MSGAKWAITGQFISQSQKQKMLYRPSVSNLRNLVVLGLLILLFQLSTLNFQQPIKSDTYSIFKSFLRKIQSIKAEEQGIKRSFIIAYCIFPQHERPFVSSQFISLRHRN